MDIKIVIGYMFKLYKVLFSLSDVTERDLLFLVIFGILFPGTIKGGFAERFQF